MHLEEYDRYMYFGAYNFGKATQPGLHGCSDEKEGAREVGKPEIRRTVNIKLRKLHLIQKAIKY